MSELLEYQHLLSELGVGVVVIGADGRVVDSNRRARELIEVPGLEFDEVNVFDRDIEVLDERGQPIPLDDLPVVRAFRTDQSVSGAVLGFRSFADESEVVWLLMGAHLVRDEVSGAIAQAICTFVDITGQRAAQAAVAESERRFRLLAENAADMIFRARVVPERVFEYVNPAVHTVLGYEPGDFYADFDLAFRLMHPDDRLEAEALFASMLLSGSDEIAPLVVRMTRNDGASIWAEFRLVPILEGRDVVAFEGIVRDVTEVKTKEADLSYQARHDALTGLPNRTMLLESLDRALVGTRAGDGAIAVLYVDLDRFKTVNDNLGHGAGDHVLTAVGIRLADAVRPSDNVARIGGDEFAAVLPGLRDEQEAVQVALRLLESISVPVALDDVDLVTTASIGVAFSGDGGETSSELLRRADVAMYRAKDRGRSRVESYAESGADPQGRHG